MSGTGESPEIAWRRAVELGKTRGYSELRACPACSGGEEWAQYAIRKMNDRYQAYFFAVDAGKTEIAEDCAEEERLEFAELEEALEHLRLRGADPRRFAPFKGQRPL